MCARKSEEFYASDLLHDVLSSGDSSRLYQRLVKDKKLFSSIGAYITDTVDEGLFVVEGKLSQGVSMDTANQAIEEVLEEVKKEKVSEEELTKIRNKIEAYLVFGETNILNRAMNLAYFEMLGNPDGVNHEIEKYQAVTADKLMETAAQIFKKENSSTVRYFSNN
jgi:zinc protease